MPQHSVNARIILRNDTAANWASTNPVLAVGEIGAENNTGLLKMGDGETPYNSLPYINDNALIDNNLITKVNGALTIGGHGRSYWTYDAELNRETEVVENDLAQWPATVQLEIKNNTARWVVPSMDIDLMRGTIDGALITVDSNRLNPQYPNEVTSKSYVDSQIDSRIAAADHLRRLVVTQLPANNAAAANTIYMVKDNSVQGSDKYREYILIDGVLTQIGDTSVDLSGYIQKVSNPTTGNLVTLAQDGSLVDSGISSAVLTQNSLSIATTTVLGGVLSSDLTNSVRVNSSSGIMEVNQITTDKLINGQNEFVLNGGHA